MISFSEKWLSKILQNKIFFPHIKFFNFFWNRWSSVELGGAQRSSAEIGGARQSSVEFGGVRRSSVELSRAQRSLVELGGARRSSVALPSVPPPQPTSLLLRFQKMRCPPPPHIAVYIRLLQSLTRAGDRLKGFASSVYTRFSSVFKNNKMQEVFIGYLRFYFLLNLLKMFSYFFVIIKKVF